MSRLFQRPVVLTVIALLGVLGIAGGLRAATLKAGAPYTAYIDEHFTLKGSAHQISAGTWDPSFYLYPSFLVDATSISAYAVATVRAERPQLRDGARVTVASSYDEVVEPWNLVLAGRLVVLACTIATVALVAALGMRLAGRQVGILAALFVAVLPMFVTRGSVVIVDTPAACFVTAALYSAMRLSTARSKQTLTAWVALAGVASGLAFTTKYDVGSVLVAVLVVAALRRDDSIAQRVKLGLVALGGFVVTSVVVMPALVFRTAAVVDAFQFQTKAYRVLAAPGADSYWQEVRSAHEIGRLVLFTGILGLGLLLRSQRARAVVIGYLAFAIPTVALLLRYPFQPARNLLPFMPFLAIAAAAAIVDIVRWAGTRLRLPYAMQGAIAVLVVLAFCWSPFQIGTRTYVSSHRKIIDTRITLDRWLDEHVQSGERVLVAAELELLPSELDQVCATVVVASQRRPAPVDDYDWVIFGDLGPALPVSPWIDALAQRAESITIGSYPMWGQQRHVRPQALEQVWHFNREQIHVVGPEGRDASPIARRPLPRQFAPRTAALANSQGTVISTGGAVLHACLPDPVADRRQKRHPTP